MIVQNDPPETVPALRLIVVLLALLAAPAGAQAASNVSIFYYPWYGTPALDGGWSHWVSTDGSTPDVVSNYFPARGLYSSSSRLVVSAQMQEIASAGVHEVITSWWGWGTPEDLRLPLVIGAARAAGLSVAVHLEPYPGRTIDTVESDIAHLRTLGITRFYVYRPFDIDVDDWTTLLEGIDGVQVFAQTVLVGRAAAAGFDGVYTYDVLLSGGDNFPRLCRQARRARLECLPSVGPGYDASRATGDPRVKPRRDGTTYDAMWKSAILSGADGVTITSYNEWHEGTQIEPARRRGVRSAATASFESYDGAYGLRGRAAEHAYLDRTAFWAARFARERNYRASLLP